jgi:hypothetical protein
VGNLRILGKFPISTLRLPPDQAIYVASRRHHGETYFFSGGYDIV